MLRQVVATGGGVVIADENRRALSGAGTVVFLAASPEEIYRRVRDQTHRPLLEVEKPEERIRALLEERDRFYRQADLTVETDGLSVQDVAEAILKYLGKEAG